MVSNFLYFKHSPLRGRLSFLREITTQHIQQQTLKLPQSFHIPVLGANHGTKGFMCVNWTFMTTL